MSQKCLTHNHPFEPKYIRKFNLQEMYKNHLLLKNHLQMSNNLNTKNFKINSVKIQMMKILTIS